VARLRSGPGWRAFSLASDQAQRSPATLDDLLTGPRPASGSRSIFQFQLANAAPGRPSNPAGTADRYEQLVTAAEELDWRAHFIVLLDSDAGMRRTARRAHVDRASVHILRHTFCSHLAMRGAPARAIHELAGHQDLATTQRYMHLRPAAVESAIRLLESPDGRPGRGNIVATCSIESTNSFRQSSLGGGGGGSRTRT
jgi:integrase